MLVINIGYFRPDTTYFEGKKTGSIKAQFGKSKESLGDCKLMTLVLVVDASGFPKESHVLEGNVCKPGTLEGILDKLKKLDQAGETKTLVIDADIATMAHIFLLVLAYQYGMPDIKQTLTIGFKLYVE